jgi:REP element-mobilizing transposase RayT
MSRARKAQVQVEIELKTWGGKRKGAGRPPKGFRSSEPHKQRERFTLLTAVHVTLRLVSKFGSLRKRDTYLGLRKATCAVLGRSDFRIVHLSPENDHVHVIVEAENNAALAKGIQAFEISAAQHLNQAITKRRGHTRRGKVFADRYHARLIKSPTQARHAINYVLNNWRRHDQDEVSEAVRFWDVDYMSSAVSFGGWKELESASFKHNIDPAERLCVARPQSWLLAAGWRKAGSISMFSVPGPARRR